MRHLFECPMRWADLDLLGHVNNVTYVDYLQEARIDMLNSLIPVRSSDRPGEGVVVVRHEVQFTRPLVWQQQPVHVESWVTQVRAASFSMAYEIFDVDQHSGERRVYLRATSTLAPFLFEEERPRRITPDERAALETLLEPGPEAGPRMPAYPEAGAAHVYPLAVRWSDVDAYGHVNNVTYFEYFQEARIQYLTSLPLPEDGRWSQWVVAQSDVEYRRPILFRLERYAVHSWFTSVGEKSGVIVAEIRDGDEVLARGRAVMVAFDAKTQRATEMNPAQRQRLLDQVR